MQLKLVNRRFKGKLTETDRVFVSFPIYYAAYLPLSEYVRIDIVY